MYKSFLLLVLVILSPALNEKIHLKTGSDPVIVPLTMDQILSSTKEDTLKFQYYSLNLTGTTIKSNQKLIISAVTSQHVFISLYINVINVDSNKAITDQLPSLFKNDITCYNQNVVSCVIMNPKQNSTIVIGVWAINNFSYMISPEIQTVNSLKVYDEDVNLYLESQFSQIYLLNLTQSYAETKNYSEIAIRGQYQGAADLDYSIFSMKACRLSKDKTTLSSNSCTKSVALGASSQYLKLQNHNQSYYLVISGQNTLHIGLSIYTPTSQIKLSEITQYLYSSSSSLKQIKQFSFNINNDNNSNNGNVTNTTDIDYGVYIQKLTGDGIITLSACNFNHDINLQFGYSAYIIIPNTILTCEDPVITIALNPQNWKDIWQIGMRMIVQHYQQIDTDNNDILYLGEQRIQILQRLTQGCINLSMQQLRTDYQQVMLLRYQSNIPYQTIILNTCQQQQCKNSTNIIQYNQKTMLYLKNIEQTTDLQLCAQNTKNIQNNIPYYYSILVLPFPYIKTVDLNKQILDIVNNNQTIVYMINAAYNRNNYNVLKIQVNLVNGDISMYDTCSQQFYDQDNLHNLKYECSNSENSTAWRYYVSYNLDQYDQDSLFQLVKFGVRGNSQSLYSIYAYIQGNNPQPIPPGPTPDPTPEPTPKPDTSQILQDGLNKIIITDKKSYTFVYNSHIIPYAIQLSYQLKSQNWCLQLFQSEEQLKKTDICSTSSIKLVQDSYRISTMYIRITNQQTTNITSADDLQLTITPSVVTLTTTRPSVLSCSKACYTQVQIPNFDFGGSDQNIVVVYGPGYINSTVYGNPIWIQFTSVPFIFTANLKQAGQLFIQIGGNGPHIITKNISVLQLVYFQNLQIIVPVNSLPTLLINSYGRNFTASWNLFTINNSQYNTFSYYYPDTTNPSYISKYASSISPIILQNNQQNSVSPLCYWSEQLSCFYTVSLKSNLKMWDILNSNNEVQINMDSNLDLLFMNIPTTVTNYFGIKYHRVMLLKADHGKLTNQFELVKQRISLQPISACGALEAGLIVADAMFGEKQGSNQKYLQVYSTQACMYNVAITQCTLPMTFTGLPRAITMNLTQGYQTLYRPPSSASELMISLWKNLTQSSPTSSGQSLIISVYSIQNLQNCTSQQNKLISTTIMNLKESIYKTTQLSSYIKISINQQKSTNLYLISIIASQTTDQILPLSLLITSNENQLILTPNSLPIPIMALNSYKTIYNYYTNDNMWQLCYYLTNTADKSYNFTIDIQNNNLNIIQKQINSKLDQHQGCIDINKINLGSNITQYQIILSSNTNLAQSDTIWLYINQYVQSIQTNYPHTTIYQPQSLLLSTPNGKYGRCYSYDVTSIQSSINIIFYPQVSQQYFGNVQSIVSVQGKKLQYSISQIRSVRTHKVKLYKVMIATTQFKENNVVACFSYPSGFFTKVVDEIDNFMVIFNQESMYRQIAAQDSAQAIQGYKYVQINVNRPQQKQWLVTQVISCQGSTSSSNLTLLGSSSIQDIILGNIAQFDKVFKNFSMLAGITPLKNNQFYIGLKHSGLDSFNYSITTYKTNSSVLPHSRWTLANPKMSCTQSEDKKDLIVLLPQVTTISNISSANIKYSIYAIPRANTTLHALNQKSIRCPTFSLKNLNTLKIYNNTMTNPKIPLLKINIYQLPSKNVTIMGVVTIIQNQQSMPINYFYTSENVQISQDGNETNGQGNSKSNMALLFLIIAIAIFLVLMSRLIYKIIKKRMSRNNVDFELQTRSAQSPAEVVQPQAQTTQINRTSVRQSIGYNQFVDEQVAV